MRVYIPCCNASAIVAADSPQQITRAQQLVPDVRQVLRRAGGDERVIADMSPQFYADLV